MTMQFTIVILLVCVRGSLQIINGSIPKTDKPYMVYLLKAETPRSPYHAAQDPTGWTCGGVIIHPLYVLTSSICLADIEMVYVISGYRKYVNADSLETDSCLMKMKKRIIAHCRLETTNYDINTFAKFYYQQPKWIVKDIATARVDTPFEFHDNRYLQFCSYKPSMIKVNYLRKYEAPGTVAMALGWGHTKYYRSIHDFNDYNSQNLMYTTTELLDREKCVQAFTPNAESDFYKTALKESSFCTFAPGNVDSDGVPTQIDELWSGNYNDTYKEKNSIYYSWDRRSLRSNNYTKSNISKYVTNEHSQKDATIRHMRRYYLRKEGEEKTQNKTTKEKKETTTAINTEGSTTTTTVIDKTTVKNTESATTTHVIDKTTVKNTESAITTTTVIDKTTVKNMSDSATTEKTNGSVSSNDSTTRPEGWEGEQWAMTGKPDLGPNSNALGNGICQNDHGGPLVAWIGGHERVIGVATAFKVTKQMECRGPFLFVSTACANQLILCTVNRKERRRSMGCDTYDLLRQGLRIVEKTVSWAGHPDAPKQIVQELDQDDYSFLDNWYGS